MPTLFCTAKYRRTFALPEKLTPSETDEGALGPWYANSLSIGSLRLLHYISSPSLLSVVITLRTRSSAEARFRDTLTRLLESLAVPPEWIASELALMANLQYGRANNRSVQGSQRDQALAAVYRLRNGASSLDQLNEELATTPCGPLNYKSPQRVAPDRLAARWRWTVRT